MATFEVGSMRELGALLKKHMRAREARIRTATKRAAHDGAKVVRRNAPQAFGDLTESVHVEGSQIITDAPHAAALENGSRPHYPPLAPLIAWVKLRGAQGLNGGKLRGSTSRAQARRVASQLKAMASGGANSVDDPETIARAIQHAIGVGGTKPHHYTLRSMPDIEAILKNKVDLALPDKGSGGSDSSVSEGAGEGGAGGAEGGTATV